MEKGEGVGVMEAKAILIADDAPLNREILKEIFRDKYEILEASDGAIAMKLIEERNKDIAIVLLDLFMPNKNGYDVLDYMNFNQYLRYIPVILITAEDSPESEEVALEYGASDYIRKPFHLNIVKHRVERTIRLYNSNKNLELIIDDQTKQLEEFSDSIINVFTSILQYKRPAVKKSLFRVHGYTKALLDGMYLDSENFYALTPRKISMITLASTVRNIGELAIDDAIVDNKENLTAEQHTIFIQHTIRGCEIIKAMSNSQNRMFVKYALEICRYHHERWDGSGYPYGLVGDEIPISAQIVSIADTYDWLRTERPGYSDYTHRRAMDALARGEFGVFSPVLTECCKMADENIEKIYEESIP